VKSTPSILLASQAKRSTFPCNQQISTLKAPLQQLHISIRTYSIHSEAPYSHTSNLQSDGRAHLHRKRTPKCGSEVQATITATPEPHRIIHSIQQSVNTMNNGCFERVSSVWTSSSLTVFRRSLLKSLHSANITISYAQDQPHRPQYN
jgi:hypothetical protein